MVLCSEHHGVQTPSTPSRASNLRGVARGDGVRPDASPGISTDLVCCSATSGACESPGSYTTRLLDVLGEISDFFSPTSDRSDRS